MTQGHRNTRSVFTPSFFFFVFEIDTAIHSKILQNRTVIRNM